MLIAKVRGNLPFFNPLSRRSVMMAGAALAASPFFLARARAQTTSQQATSPQVTWQMATEYPQSNISGIGLATFGRLVAERTNSVVTTVNAFDNELKVPSGEMLRAVQER